MLYVHVFIAMMAALGLGGAITMTFGHLTRIRFFQEMHAIWEVAMCHQRRTVVRQHGFFVICYYVVFTALFIELGWIDVLAMWLATSMLWVYAQLHARKRKHLALLLTIL